MQGARRDAVRALLGKRWTIHFLIDLAPTTPTFVPIGRNFRVEDRLRAEMGGQPRCPRYRNNPSCHLPGQSGRAL